MMETSTATAVVDAPSTTSTETSVPSSGAASTTTPTRPASMQAALEQADVQFADSGTAAPYAVSATGTSGSGSSPQGPIPFQVHKTALENARTKAQAEALRGITPEQFTEMLGWYQRAAQDTTGFLTETLASHPQAIEILQRALQTLQSHPTHGPQLKSLAGKALAAARGQGSPQAPAMVKVQLEDGSVVPMPRDPDAYLAFHRQQWERGVGEQLAPLTQTVSQLQAEHDAAVWDSQVTAFVGTTLEDIKTFPGVDDAAMGEMAKFIATIPMANPNDPREVQRAVDLAYRKVVVPTLSQKAQQAYGASLKQKAAAQIETASSRAATPLSKPKNVSELAKLLETLEAGAR